MNHIQLLQLARNALNMCPRKSLHGLGLMPAPFNGRHDSYKVVAAIEDYLESRDRFSVTIAYPGSGEGDYRSSSRAPTWEEAVKVVANEMRDDGPLEVGDEIAVLDIIDLDHGGSVGPRDLMLRFGPDYQIEFLEGQSLH